MELFLRLAAALFLAGCNAFFVATEFALTRVRQFPKEDFQSSRGLRKAWQMTDRLEIYLTSCQVGITISSILLGVVAEPAVTALWEPLVRNLPIAESSIRLISIVLSVAFLNLLHMVVGEQAPTYLGVERPKRVAEVCAPVHYHWTRLMSPAIRLGDYLAKSLLFLVGVEMKRSWKTSEEDAEGEIGSMSELVERMGQVLARGKISEDRRREVIGALKIGETPVSEIMTAREEMVALQAGESFESNLEKIAASGHVRFPLYGESPDDFLGLIYTPGLFSRLEELREGTLELRELAAEPLEVPADMPVSRLIDTLQEKGQEAAIVTEGGRTRGFITATDAFEAIIGDLKDPYD